HTRSNPTTGFVGAAWPREVIVRITTDAESAAVMKKIAKTPMRIYGVILLHGSVSNSLNRTASGEASPSNPSTPLTEFKIDEPPKTVNAKIRIKLGTPMVTSANSRSVRPREIRAIYVPTKWVHAIHHAQ